MPTQKPSPHHTWPRIPAQAAANGFPTGPANRTYPQRLRFRTPTLPRWETDSTVTSVGAGTNSSRVDAKRGNIYQDLQTAELSDCPWSLPLCRTTGTL